MVLSEIRHTQEGRYHVLPSLCACVETENKDGLKVEERFLGNGESAGDWVRVEEESPDRINACVEITP